MRGAIQPPPLSVHEAKIRSFSRFCASCTPPSGESESAAGSPSESLSNTGDRRTDDSPLPDQLEAPVSQLGRRFRVIVHNDEVTPMDFVVRILTGVHRLGVEHAIEVMLEAHHADSAWVSSFGLEEAEFRVQQSHHLARNYSYPLTFTIESE